jgi:hypothetical protein
MCGLAIRTGERIIRHPGLEGVFHHEVYRYGGEREQLLNLTACSPGTPRVLLDNTTGESL